jgi:APA family basic amino acid/polyamine antiporter
VAISWSDYLVSLLSIIKIPALGIHGIHVPEWMTMDYFSAKRGHEEVMQLLSAGGSNVEISDALREANAAWTGAPCIGSFHLVLDIPALAIIAIITWLVYRGIKETRNASNVMVAIKLLVILLIIGVGVFYVDTSNWTPFAPNGVSGILKGVSAVFFAYIGFDAISTTAEECKNPQRDLPKAMMYSIIICTVLYIIIALIITGMVSYTELNVGDPLAFVFEKLNLNWFSGIIAVSAVVAMASVLLVFQLTPVSKLPASLPSLPDLLSVFLPCLWTSPPLQISAASELCLPLSWSAAVCSDWEWRRIVRTANSKHPTSTLSG